MEADGKPRSSAPEDPRGARGGHAAAKLRGASPAACWAAAAALAAAALAIASACAGTTGGAVIRSQIGGGGYEVAAIERASASGEPAAYGIAGTLKAAELADELDDERLAYRGHRGDNQLGKGAAYTLTIVSKAGRITSLTVSEGRLRFNGTETAYDLSEGSDLYELCKAAFKTAKGKFGEQRHRPGQGAQAREEER